MSFIETFSTKAEEAYVFLGDLAIVKSLRQSLVALIPVLLIGSFALVFESFPLDAYQDWLETPAGSCVYNIASFANSATFGMLGLYLSVTFAVHYMDYRAGVKSRLGLPLASAVSFCILSGLVPVDIDEISNFGVNGVFTAIVSTIVVTHIYSMIVARQPGDFKMYSSGFDATFREMSLSVLPIVLTTMIVGVIELAIYMLTGTCFQNFVANLLVDFFSNIGATLPGMLFFVFFEHVVWFFGIHGGNVLNPVKESVFIAALDPSSTGDAVVSTFYNSSFLDVFVLMGGCGAALSLIIALLIFSKKRSTRYLTRYAAIPVLFNINEAVVFALPIVFNPIFLIPFLLVPIVNIFIATAAISSGLVPIPVNQVSWTVPILMGGYVATGSISGSVLQAVNIAVGALIYAPFVKLYDRVGMSETKRTMDEVVGILKESEDSRQDVTLMELTGSKRALVTALADQIDYDISTGNISMFYQPQYDNQGKPIGAEALFRMTNATYGTVYPPLVFKVAQEARSLGELEQAVFREIVSDLPELKKLMGKDTKISANVTGHTIQTDAFEEFLRQLAQEHPDCIANLDIEITEQASLNVNQEFVERLTRIKEMGFTLVIDDFSMGNTSIKYLQSDLFSIVKLDGGISKDIMGNERTKDIVSMISDLSRNLGITVLAEYVETEEQRSLLESLGCSLYQGYLYSPAVPLDKLGARLEEVNGKLHS